MFVYSYSDGKIWIKDGNSPKVESTLSNVLERILKSPDKFDLDSLLSAVKEMFAAKEIGKEE